MMNAELTSQIFQRVEGDYTALMLFGSTARSESNFKSDVDVLQLSKTNMKPYNVGKINFSTYTHNHLNKLVCSGSLFALHLKMEGEVVADSSGELVSILDSFVHRKTYEDFRSELAIAAKYLNVSEEGYLSNFKRLNSLCIYIVRSTVFSLCADLGKPSFSIIDAVKRIDDLQLLKFLSLKYLDAPNFELFNLGRKLLNKYLKIESEGEFVCPEMLVLESAGKSDLVVSLGRRLLGQETWRHY